MSSKSQSERKTFARAVKEASIRAFKARTGRRSTLEERSYCEITAWDLAMQPLDSAVKSVMLTLTFKELIEKSPPEGVGKFQVRFSTKGVHHVDAPIQMQFLAPNEKVVATAGFFVQAGKPKELQITNLQGKDGHEALLKDLSRELGENWRVWAAKRFKRIAESKKMGVVGVLPRYFSTLLGDDVFKWKRRVRQYRQTFRKAGIERIDSRFIVKPSELSMKLSREARAYRRKEKPKAEKNKRKRLR